MNSKKLIAGSLFQYSFYNDDKHFFSAIQAKCNITQVAESILEKDWVDDVIYTKNELLIFAKAIYWTDLENIKIANKKSKKTLAIPIVIYSEEIISPYLNQIDLDYSNFKETLLKNNYELIMKGFIPGFIYLGGLAQKLHCPRDSKATIIPAGSLAIGGEYLGVYPKNIPGAWNVIGQCPLKLSNKNYDDYLLIDTSFIIKFIEISNKESDLLSSKNFDVLEYNGYDRDY